MKPILIKIMSIEYFDFGQYQTTSKFVDLLYKFLNIPIEYKYYLTMKIKINYDSASSLGDVYRLDFNKKLMRVVAINYIQDILDKKQLYITLQSVEYFNDKIIKSDLENTSLWYEYNTQLPSSTELKRVFPSLNFN